MKKVQWCRGTRDASFSLKDSSSLSSLLFPFFFCLSSSWLYIHIYHIFLYFFVICEAFHFLFLLLPLAFATIDHFYCLILRSEKERLWPLWVKKGKRQVQEEWLLTTENAWTMLCLPNTNQLTLVKFWCFVIYLLDYFIFNLITHITIILLAHQLHLQSK